MLTVLLGLLRGSWRPLLALALALVAAFGVSRCTDYRSEAKQAVSRAEQAEANTERLRTAYTQVSQQGARVRIYTEKAAEATGALVEAARESIPDDAPPLPGAWRLRHDEAAAGVPPASAPSGGADAAPIAPEDAAEVVIENYGQYHDLANKHAELQRYVREQCVKEPK